MFSGEIQDSGIEPNPVDLALEQLTTGLDHLIKLVEDGGLDSYDNAGLLGFLQSFERFRNRLPLIDHRAIRDAQARSLPDALTQTSLAKVLISALRLSPGDAHRRVKAAEAVGDRVNMLGQPLDPVRPVLAAAQRSGEVTPEQVHIISRALASVDRPGFDQGDIAAGEELLTGFAASFGPRELSALAEKTVDAINPDGTLAKEQLNNDRRHLILRQSRDGAYVGEFRLTGTLGAKLLAVLSPLAKPRVETITLADGSKGHGILDVDERSHGQRMHDALEDVCDRMLRSTGLPDSGGTPATVIVTISIEDLLAKAGYGTVSDGTLIPAGQLLKIANAADIIPTVLAKSGAVLDQGRSRRVATVNQTLALTARDRGCSFPGCAHPPEWCERHHITPWIDGGKTDLSNLTLLCRYHHHNFLSRGWTCEINADGLPWWRPPRWLDPQQRPILNTRIQLAHLHESTEDGANLRAGPSRGSP
jgi:Domain of unknown function (DUF222)/HNH endonuclease